MVKSLNFSISEMFLSLQGESSFAGYPCIFIRLSGCNLRCFYCDAKYTYNEPPAVKSITEILDYVDQYPDVMVEITGGEPLAQPNCAVLASELVQKGHKTLIETNGSYDISVLPLDCVAVIDIKCPDSGSADSFHLNNFQHIMDRGQQRFGSCEIKFVLSSVNDFYWAKEMVLQHQLHLYCPVHFSPVTDSFPAVHLSELIMKYMLPVRLQLQLHTILWPGLTRGV